MMLVTISIAIILNPTFVTAQSCDDSIRPPACGLIHEDAWIPMQNAYQQIQNAISDHDDRLIQHHIAINTAIGNIGNIGDITQHDADIKAAITTHGAAIGSAITDIDGDIVQHDNDIKAAINNIADDINNIDTDINTIAGVINTIDGAITQHDADIKAAITTHGAAIDSAITDIDGDIVQHDNDIKAIINNIDTD
eukprot:473254_1